MYQLSIILPVYNSEEYIHKAIESVMKQQIFKNIQLVIIDDGSTDGTLHIIDQYQKQYSNICVIHKENGGVSEARNLGVSYAEGTFITFLDADDYYVGDLSESLTFATLRQLVTFNIKKSELDDKMLLDFSQYQETILINNEMKKEYVYGNLTSVIAYSVNNKIYQTQIIKDNKIKFHPDTKYAEDMLFNLEYMKYIDTVYLYNKPIYLYVDQPSSSMHQMTLQSLEHYFVSYQQLLIYCNLENISNRYASDWLFDKIVYVIFGIIYVTKDKVEKQKEIKDICHHTEIKKSISGFHFRKLSLKRKVIYILYKFNLLSIIVRR